MRTREEIIHAIETAGHEGGTFEDDIFGFSREVLAEFLSYEDVIAIFGEQEFIAEDWNAIKVTADSVRDQIIDYMEFAIIKATGHRGLSSDRSIQKMHVWIWLLGNEEYTRIWTKNVGQKPYKNYGAPKLMAICQEFDIAIPGYTDGEDFTYMAESQPCRLGCDMGCAR
jgi:hypothetical protein